MESDSFKRRLAPHRRRQTSASIMVNHESSWLEHDGVLILCRAENIFPMLLVALYQEQVITYQLTFTISFHSSNPNPFCRRT